MKIGVIGGGFVGRATAGYKCSKVDVMVFDVNRELCDPKDVTLERVVEDCNLVFVCVPTPAEESGKCFTEVVEQVVADLKRLKSKLNRHHVGIVVKSTVPVGTCRLLGVFHMPEFLTEKRWVRDFYSCKIWILGSPVGISEQHVQDVKEVVQTLIDFSQAEDSIASSHLCFVDTNESEMIKYGRNAFLALKVAYFNELFDFCAKKKCSFETVRQLVTCDDRIGSSHSDVPGHDGNKGFGGTCLPKDISSLIYEMRKEGLPTLVISSARQRNLTLDRLELDSDADEGRSVVFKN